MKIHEDKIRSLIVELDEIISVLISAEEEHQEEIDKAHPAFKDGARNLLHYRIFRSLDLKKFQKRLSRFGLSILASTESHVMATLLNSRFILRSLLQELDDQSNQPRTSVKRSRKHQKKHAKDLFGYRSKDRRVRIMVTMPTEAAYNYEFVHDLLAAGMNTARINCAHDGPEIWSLMIDNLNQAKEALNKNCKVFMDLGGPKVRTGPLEAGPKIRRFRPKRNDFGEVIQPAHIELVTDLDSKSSNQIPVKLSWLKSLEVGDKINLKDSREKKRQLVVKSVLDDKVIATCSKTTYFETGLNLKSLATDKKTKVGDLPTKDEFLLINTGDHLRLMKEQVAGKASVLDENNEIIAFAQISCTAPKIFDCVKAGERILFDDGKISGVIKTVSESEILVEVVKAKANGTKLKADKGINLPDTDLNFSGLTEKDIEDLAFVVEHADGVNVSFVNSPEDVEKLFFELDKLEAPEDLGIVLKIETQKAYDNLFDILLAGMQRYPTGVMVARGDLAIETGWENMARIQNEILRLCDSAYVPSIWATQVLENLAKTGIPSRSELTDVASSLKADAIMLNKGPYILDAITLLHQILSSMNSYRDKDVRMFEAIK